MITEWESYVEQRPFSACPNIVKIHLSAAVSRQPWNDLALLLSFRDKFMSWLIPADYHVCQRGTLIVLRLAVSIISLSQWL